MAINRIYLGVDPHSNLAVSLEPAPMGYFYLTVSATDLRNILCRFLCTDEDLDQIGNGKTIEMEGCQGKCTVRSSGDEIIFEVHRRNDHMTSTCALSNNSYSRVVRLAKSRAYIG